LAERKLLKGNTISVDATTLESQCGAAFDFGATRAHSTTTFSHGWDESGIETPTTPTRAPRR